VIASGCLSSSIRWTGGCGARESVWAIVAIILIIDGRTILYFFGLVRLVSDSSKYHSRSFDSLRCLPVMDAPTLVLVPPTPLRFDIPTKSPPSPPPQARPRPASTAQRRLTQTDPPRDSSDAIFSIYSMYGDEQNSRASARWSKTSARSAGNHNHDRAQSKDSNFPPTVTLNLPNNKRSSFFATNGYAESDLAYYSEPDTDYPPPPPPAAEKPEFYPGTMAAINDSPRISVASSTRAPSSYATPSSLRTPSDLFDDGRIASGSQFRSSDLSASSYTPGTTQSREFRSGSSHSKRSSRGSSMHQQNSIRDLPPLPPSRQTTPSPSTPPRQPSPSPALLTTPKSSSIQYVGKHQTPYHSPSSKVSLVPSEGEDMDAFHVRNTYAQLEASGVKGDGYEEGVERTRARVGNSRSSQLQADAALGDGQEKKRDLDPKELQVLRSVDR